MQRVPEPELMDDRNQARAYAEADFSEPNQLFLDCFRKLFDPPTRTAQVIDLGCGPADITLEFARCYPETIIRGLDGAESMLAFGRAALEREPGLKRRVTLIRDRLPSPLLPSGFFDIVLSNSLLHHLNNPRVLWGTIKDCGRQGAAILIMDLMRPPDTTAVDSLVNEYAGDAPEVLRRDFRNSLCAAFTPEEVYDQLLREGLSDLRIDVVSDRHLTVAGHLPELSDT